MENEVIELSDLPHDEAIAAIIAFYGVDADRAEFFLSIELGEFSGDFKAVNDEPTKTD